MCGLLPVAFLADSIGVGEIVLLFLVILVFFGPRRLPDMARQLGRMVAELRRASQNFRDQMMQMDREPPVAGRTAEPPAALLPPAIPAAKPDTPASVEPSTHVEPGEKNPHDRAG